MNEIIRFGGQLEQFSNEVRAINRLEDWEARFARLCILIEQIQSLGGHAGKTLAGIEAELNAQKKVNALERLESEERALIETFDQAQPDPAVFYDCARFANICGNESEAALLIRLRLSQFKGDLVHRSVSWWHTRLGVVA